MKKKLIIISSIVVVFGVIGALLMSTLNAGSSIHEAEDSGNKLKYASVNGNYVEFDEKKDAYVEMKGVNFSSSGNATLTFYYSSSNSFPVELKVNGDTIVKEETFDSSSSGKKSFTANMENSSNNKIRFKIRAAVSGVKLDKVEITTEGSSDSVSATEVPVTEESVVTEEAAKTEEAVKTEESAKIEESVSENNSNEGLVAFPGAEGYGKNTVGGRGGKVYEVTNLNDSGTGSLRAAVEASGARTVVFRVSGTINLTKTLKISNPYITIAGQTAPGDGITLKKYPLDISADQVIIRYIRSRYGDELKNDADAMSMRYHKNIILDHITASWGDDESMSIYHGEYVTIQWSLVSETLNRGGDHGFAGIWGSPYSTHHHNLIANNVSRSIRFASGGGNVDYRNNVIYNWGYNSAYGGEKQQEGNDKFNFSNINMVANYYKPGPATESDVKSRIVNPTTRDGANDFGKFYVADNFVEGDSKVSADNWDGGVQPQGGSSFISGLKLDKPWNSMAINQQTAKDAYQSVLESAGCSLKRDSVDERIINEVRTGTATYGNKGIIESQSEVGGWPKLNSTAAPADSDHDGMPDSWEKSNGLDPNNANDRNNKDSVGYTMLENYLNSID